MNDSEALKTVSLHDRHIELGARMVPFAGYSMPVKYTKIKEEHQAVRSSAGLFDVSHMGRVEIVGEDALKAVNALITNDVAKLSDGRALYTVMCNEEGGIVDDLVVYRLAEDRLLLCVNGANRERDLEYIANHLSGAAQIDDRSEETMQIALQGPDAEVILSELTDVDLKDIKFFRCRETTVADIRCLVARTGYTGEDGFELYLSRDGGQTLFDALINSGVTPCGLGCRDTLRLEAGLLLHGQDIDESTNPLEAGLSWLVKFKSKGDFVGRQALEKIRDRGISRRLRGLVLQDRGVLRPGYPIEIGGEQVGAITSGSYAPTLEASIGLGYIDTAHDEADTAEVVIRGRNLEARLVDPPFYERAG